MGDHPYCAEYAKSGRSKCRGCTDNIEHGLVRIGVTINSQITHWFHKDCFFKRHKPENTDVIANFKKLKDNEKAYIRANIGVQPIEPAKTVAKRDNAGEDDEEDNVTEGAKPKKQKVRKPKTGNGGKSKFMVDYSLSNRASCCSCHEKIEKGVVRIARMDYTSNKGYALNGIPRWYHVKCFVSNRDFFEFWDSAEALPGFFALQKGDREELLEVLPENTIDQATVDGAGGWKLLKIEEHTFKKLKANLETLTAKELESILKHNKQEVQKAAKKKELLDTVCMLARYGVVGKCPQCNSNSLINERGNIFACSTIAEEKPCGYTSDAPPLVELKIPKKLRDEIGFLNQYDFKIQDRVLKAKLDAPPSLQLNANAAEFVPGQGQPNKPKGPLSGMEFFVLGVKEAKEIIVKLGGRVVIFVSPKTKAVISDEESFSAARSGKDKRMHYIENYSTPIVGMDFLEEVQRGNRNMKKLLRECDMASDWLYDMTEMMNEKYGPWGRNYW